MGGERRDDEGRKKRVWCSLGAKLVFKLCVNYTVLNATENKPMSSRLESQANTLKDVKEFQDSSNRLSNHTNVVIVK